MVAAGPACKTPSALSKAGGDYLAHNPQLTAEEIDRIYQREGRTGDTLDRLKVAFEGCELERLRQEGDLEVYDLKVPISVRGVRLRTGAHLDWLRESGNALLTFDHRQLKSYTILDGGMR